jgi:Shikimate 5-dehydrogenase
MVTGKARVAGIIGWPVAHSLSPRLHGWWLDRYGIDGAYVPLPVPPVHVADAIAALPRLGFAGANVTVPHKEAALAAVDRVSPEARRIGAVNTLVVNGEGCVEGRNTDAFGFVENLRANVPGWTAVGGRAVVLGAGGAARAVVDALLQGGAAEVRLINRSRERAEALAAAFDGRPLVRPWEDRDAALAGATLLVNTTTLGMAGHPPLPLVLDALPIDAVVTDIVYVPLITPLLSATAARGHRAVDGLGMLLHQARAGFAAWFGVEPEVTAEVRDFVLAGLAVR